MKEFLLIPKEDIDALEEARISLFKLANGIEVNNITAGLRVRHISQPMWKLTHTKYAAATDYAELDPATGD